MITPLEPGLPAPEFHLPDDSGSVRHLSDYTGQWLVVWWNPLALSKGCRSCGQKAIDAVRVLRSAGASLVGITMDSVAENAEKSLFVFESTFPVLSSDWDTANEWKVARPLDSPWAMVPHPIAYLVRPDGVVERSWFVERHNERQHIDGVLDILAERAEKVG